MHLTHSPGLEQPEYHLELFSHSGFSSPTKGCRATQVRQQKSNLHRAPREHMWNQLVRCRLKPYIGLSVLVPVLLSIPVFGALGQDVSSVASDQAHLKASTRVLNMTSYTVHEMRTPTGTTIRQFASPAGTVFAVTWQGFSPDLQQLLGEYFDEYVTTASSQHAQRGRGVYIDTGDLVVETGGHMRYAVGRAYLRSQVPQGVDANALR